MLLTFVGQAFASATLSCNHDMAMGSSMTTNSNMPDTVNHADMMMQKGVYDDDQNALMDCCQEECKCPMSGCISVSLLFSNIHFTAEIFPQQKIVQLPLIHQSQINTSLYRPPIS
jgi:hypothetical protein